MCFGEIKEKSIFRECLPILDFLRKSLLNMSHFWTIIFSTKYGDNIVFTVIVIVVNMIYIRVFCITINVNISHRNYCCPVNQRYGRYRCRSCRDRYRSCHVNINPDVDIALVIISIVSSSATSL